jgi:hypothetical protein
MLTAPDVALIEYELWSMMQSVESDATSASIDGKLAPC